MVDLPLPLTRLIRALGLLIHRMVKRVRRFVSGQTEVARICGERRQTGAEPAEHNADMTAALWNEWRTSRKLQLLFAERAKDANMPIENTAEQISESKQIAESPHVSENLRKCLRDIKGVNEVIASVKQLASQPFVAGNDIHEAKLEELWQHLLPGQERDGGRYSKDWGNIGFQQADPASDFRGGGLLGLDQLLYLATERTTIARRMISEPASEASQYPWACVGINLTMEAMRMLEERKLDASLYGKSVADSIKVFHGFYADMFEILHARWVRAKPENLLAFPAVKKETLAAIEHEVSEAGSLVPPGTSA